MDSDSIMTIVILVITAIIIGGFFLPREKTAFSSVNRSPIAK